MSGQAFPDTPCQNHEYPVGFPFTIQFPDEPEIMNIQCNYYIIFLLLFHQFFTYPSTESPFIQKSGERVPPLSYRIPAGGQ